MNEKAIALVSILLAVSSVVFAFSSAATQFAVLRPYVAGLVTVSATIESVRFLNYQEGTMRYATVNCTIRNPGNSPITARCRVYLYDANGSVVAYAVSPAVSVSPAANTTVSMLLNWTPGRNMTSAVSGRVSVEP